MDSLVNNFYFSSFTFIIAIILFAISVINTMKNKYYLNIKDKISLKTINYNFLIRMLSLSFSLAVLSEQLIYSFF